MISYYDVINFATNRNILSGSGTCMSILVDLMLSENDKFKVCIRIPFAAIFVVVAVVLLHYHQSIITSYM